MNLDEFRTRWLADRPLYLDFAMHVGDLLRSSARDEGIICDISARPKDLASLLTKVIRKNYNDYQQITDKAGVRLTAHNPDSIDAINKMVRRVVDVKKYEDKGSVLAPDQFGYSGKHYEISLKADGKSDVRFRDLMCEVQVHTRAQNLWSDFAHELTYKPASEPPDDMKRAVNRLEALLEIFDDQVVSTQRRLACLPDFREAAMLNELEKSFYRFVGRRFDRALSLQILGVLVPVFEAVEFEKFGRIVTDFVAANATKLKGLYEKYKDDERCNPFLFQPECIAIFERLEKDKFRLKSVWDKKLPPEYLDGIAVVWGVAI